MYYNLICIFICTPMWIKFNSCKKWVLQNPKVLLLESKTNKELIPSFAIEQVRWLLIK
jgi:hypothetical protein